MAFGLSVTGPLDRKKQNSNNSTCVFSKKIGSGCIKLSSKTRARGKLKILPTFKKLQNFLVYVFFHVACKLATKTFKNKQVFGHR